VSFVAFSSDPTESMPEYMENSSYLKNYSKLSKTCDFDISEWTNIVKASNANDAIFSGDVLFEINNKKYKTNELYVKNFHIRKDCEIRSSLVMLLK